MFFVLMGSACAVEVSDASNTEDSNLTNDNVVALSQEKLEVSSENSISETNLVNSHDDNLEDYPDDSLLKASDESYCEDNKEQTLGLAKEEVNETVSVSADDVVLAKSNSNTNKIETNLSIINTHYCSSATSFRVSLQDVNGKNIGYKKVSLKVNGKTYEGKTNKNGVVYIKTAALAVGTYTVTLNYAGNSNYSASSLSKKVSVIKSVRGKDLTKYYGDSNYYSVTFWKNTAYLTNTDVTFYIGNTKYTTKTNSKGVAVAKATIKPGKYTVTTTNPYSNEKIKNTITVKKDTTTIKGKSKVYILPNYKYNYEVVLTSGHNAPAKNCKVSFRIANTTLTANTDKNGKASVVIPLLAKGTYNITYRFGGNGNYYASNSSGKVCIKSASNKLVASDLTMKYKDGSKFTVQLTDNSGKALTGKTINFKLNNKDYSSKTNSKGVASLSIGNLKPGSYKIKYSYSSRGLSDYNYGYRNVVINKLSVKFNAWNLVMKPNDGSTYKAYVKDNSGKALKNVGVSFKVNGKTYTQKTDSKGVARLKITLPVGYYEVNSTVSDSYYKSDKVSKHILVNGTKFIASNMNVLTGSSASYSVKYVDAKNNPIKSASIKFTINGKTYTKKTNSNGVAKVALGELSNGYHTIKYAHDSTKGSSKIHVVDKVTLNQIISASKSVKAYIEDNEKLPSTVKIGGVTFSTAEYLYLASKAIVNLNSSKKSDIGIKVVKNPAKPGAASNLGNLNNYLAVAKSVIKTTDSKGQMPDSVSSSVGTIGYKGLVYAFARVVAFYGDNKVMPSYVVIKSLSSSSSTSSLNSKNTISNLAAYLAASTNCQVNNSKIKQLVSKLTSGLTSDKAKATAIYNYVRDAISYSFYYDTKYGAVGTLNSKSGNCVDHSHLLVAMYRTAGLPARYVHGTCTFSSGTFGHVWTQVLIGDTWIVSDATSARNSFGNVVNWNPSSYSLHGYFSSIGF
ncbi:transglutaminase domain-containing protein [Methanobrevibacter sp.]|uniref:transglutaminase domain-containing protein n=1 Tax=Methanobrevibacter sp. TaxID=66852 RepID=UPI003863624A